MPGISAVSLPMSAARLLAALGNARDHALGRAALQPPGGEIIEEKSGSAPCTIRSLAHMATRSMPTVSCLPLSMASLSFGADAVISAATSSGSLYPAARRSKSSPKPPRSALAPGRRVDFGERGDGAN